METFKLASSLLFGIILLLPLALWILKPKHRDHAIKYPDGPRPLGILGNAVSLRRLQTQTDRELINIARTWKDMCLLWLGLFPILIVNKPQAVKELLVDRGMIYCSRPELLDSRSRIWSWRLPILSAGDRFRYLRKLYQSLLGQRRSAELRKYQDYESTTLLLDLLDQPESFLGHCERFSVNVIFSAVYGIRLGKLDDSIIQEFFRLWQLIVKHLQPGSMLADYISILQKLPLHLQPGYHYATGLRRSELQLHFPFFRTLQDAVRHGHAPDCFGKRLISAQAQDSLDDTAALDILAMIISGGAHTTNNILLSFLKLMALHPEVVEKAHLELDRVVGLDGLPSWEHQASLPYIRSLIKELHRCGFAGLGVPHTNAEDDYYHDRLIPKGTCVLPNLTALHRDPELYPNSEKFEPDRFKDHQLDASAAAIQPDYRQRDHFSYGFGRRICPGIHVAEQSLFIVISKVLWAFDIQAKPGHSLDMRSNLVGTLMQHQPFEVHVKSRGPRVSKVIKEANIQAQANAEHLVVNSNHGVMFDM